MRQINRSLTTLKAALFRKRIAVVPGDCCIHRRRIRSGKAAQHVPVGHQVAAELVSRDAVHNFGVPALRVKHDVIPGVAGSVWFTADVEGVYDIQCSALCGPRHAEMRGTVIVESAEAFRRFLADEAARLPMARGK